VHLQGLTRLKRLDLNDTQISDAGLTHLQGLTRLERLDLHGTQVSDAGVNELRKALPHVDIFPLKRRGSSRPTSPEMRLPARVANDQATAG
jgi:Leucine-rich repeat (LRR) protein